MTVRLRRAVSDTRPHPNIERHIKFSEVCNSAKSGSRCQLSFVAASPIFANIPSNSTASALSASPPSLKYGANTKLGFLYDSVAVPSGFSLM
jgi:hypothetical protein